MSSTFLADGVAWLGQQLVNHASTTVTLTRNGKTGSFSATLGNSTFESTENGVTTLIRSRDFLVPIADYKTTGDDASEPQASDVLAATIGGVSKRHRVLQGGNGHWFSLDDQGTRYRIHTKEIG